MRLGGTRQVCGRMRFCRDRTGCDARRPVGLIRPRERLGRATDGHAAIGCPAAEEAVLRLGVSRGGVRSSTTVNPMPASRRAASAVANGSGRTAPGRSLVCILVNMTFSFRWSADLRRLR